MRKKYNDQTRQRRHKHAEKSQTIDTRTTIPAKLSIYFPLLQPPPLPSERAVSSVLGDTLEAQQTGSAAVKQ